jgi:hypothetical protein
MLTETDSNHTRVFFLPYVSQLAALGPEAHAGMRGRAGAGGRGHVQAFAKYTHVEVM